MSANGGVDEFDLNEVTSIEEYVAKIANENHRAFARAKADGLETWKMTFPGVSPTVKEEIWWDITELSSTKDIRFRSAYKDHCVRQSRAQARRRQTQEDAIRWGHVRPRRPRDTQQQRLYDAEKFLRTEGRQFQSIDEIQTYIDRLVAEAWWGRRYRRVKINIKMGRAGSAARAYNYGNRISMPQWAWHESIVLHEVAHLIVNQVYGVDGVAGHGREFARILVGLVDHKMGKANGKALRESFRKHKVKFSLPRKPMSPEQRAAATERLAQARQKKVAA